MGKQVHALARLVLIALVAVAVTIRVDPSYAVTVGSEICRVAREVFPTRSLGQCNSVQAASLSAPAAAAAVDWVAIEAKAAPSVFRAKGYTCFPYTLLACRLEFNGTGYLVVSGPIGSPVLAVSAYHMACDPSFGRWIARMDWLDATGNVVFRRQTPAGHGLCSVRDRLHGYVLGDAAQDVGVWDTTIKYGLQPATRPVHEGDQVLVMGNPGGLSTGEPIAVIGTVVNPDTSVTERGEYGIPTKLLNNVIELRVAAFPGNSGSPVLNARGRVIGTLVSGGPQPSGNGTAHLAAWVVPIQAAIPWVSR